MLRRLSLTATVKSAVTATQSGTGTITDSLISTTGPASAVESDRGGHIDLRNDTIVAGAAGGIGLDSMEAFSSAHAGTIVARNVIVHANQTDLLSRVSNDPSTCTPAPCSPGGVTVDHSLFASTNGPVVDGGSNVSGDPMFADGAFSDFHLLPGSPAIDAGTSDPLLGLTDFDGRTRVLGTAPDLGAFEAPTPAAPPTAPAAAPADQGAPAGAVPAASLPALDVTAPVLSAVRVKRGKTIRYGVSEVARVTIQLARRTTKKHYRRVATLTRTAHSGGNTTKLIKRLKRGAYRATLTARDAAGNKSRQVTVKFTVVR
jgi:hypothetical protein